MSTQTITAVITGDNHLGTYYARLRPDRLQSRREALHLGFQRAVDIALAEKADLVLIVGDLFDRPDPRNADRNFVATQLSRLRDAGVRTVAICGNHDSPRLAGYDGGIVPLHEMAALGGLHLMRGETAWESLTLDMPTTGGSVTVRIRGRSHDFRQGPGECPLAGDASLGEPRAADHEIVLLHYGVEGWQPFENEPILKRENLDRLGADVIAVGHLHARNHTRLPGGALLLNPGATERMDWGEERLKTGCAVVRMSSGQPAQLEWRDFAPQPMRTLEISAADLDTACLHPENPATTAATDGINRKIEAALTEAGVEAARQMLRLRLTGVASETTVHQLDLDAVRRFGADRCFHIDIDAEELTVRYADGEIETGSGGFEIDTEIEAVVTALLAQAEPGESATESERLSARRHQAVILGAKDALLSAYQRIQPGS